MPVSPLRRPRYGTQPASTSNINQQIGAQMQPRSAAQGMFPNVAPVGPLSGLQNAMRGLMPPRRGPVPNPAGIMTPPGVFAPQPQLPTQQGAVAPQQAILPPRPQQTAARESEGMLHEQWLNNMSPQQRAVYEQQWMQQNGIAGMNERERAAFGTSLQDMSPAERVQFEQDWAMTHGGRGYGISGSQQAAPAPQQSVPPATSPARTGPSAFNAPQGISRGVPQIPGVQIGGPVNPLRPTGAQSVPSIDPNTGAIGGVAADDRLPGYQGGKFGAPPGTSDYRRTRIMPNGSAYIGPDQGIVPEGFGEGTWKGHMFIPTGQESDRLPEAQRRAMALANKEARALARRAQLTEYPRVGYEAFTPEGAINTEFDADSPDIIRPDKTFRGLTERQVAQHLGAADKGLRGRDGQITPIQDKSMLPAYRAQLRQERAAAREGRMADARKSAKEGKLMRRIRMGSATPTPEMQGLGLLNAALAGNEQAGRILGAQMESAAGLAGVDREMQGLMDRQRLENQGRAEVAGIEGQGRLGQQDLQSATALAMFNQLLENGVPPEQAQQIMQQYGLVPQQQMNGQQMAPQLPEPAEDVADQNRRSLASGRLPTQAPLSWRLPNVRDFSDFFRARPLTDKERQERGLARRPRDIARSQTGK